MNESPLPDPGLYVVAVPIGNARDITLRALDVLVGADVVACEDTRNTRRLLSLHGIEAEHRLVSYNDHNAKRRLPDLLATLERKGTVALASDAGTPLVSDPGYRLVTAALDAGVPVRAVPGPSALTAALSIAGQPTDRVVFLGFLPKAGGSRRSALETWARSPATVVIFERAERVGPLVSDLEGTLGPRTLSIVREISKLHEETVRGTCQEILDHCARSPLRGEVVVVCGPPSLPAREADADDLLMEALRSRSPSQAAAQVAAGTGLSRKALYERALALREAAGPSRAKPG